MMFGMVKKQSDAPTLSEPAPKPSAQPDLERMLVELTRYGKPRLSMVRPGLWHANIEMNTSAAGTSFEVKAEFDHKTPMEAVTTLAERMRAALAKFGVSDV